MSYEFLYGIFLYININFYNFLLQFIKNMLYFNKLIDICINRQESHKVVDNYFVGTNDLSYEVLK